MVIIKLLEPIGKEIYKNSEFKREGIVFEYQDTRGWNDSKLVEYVKDAHLLVLGNRPISSQIIHAAKVLKLLVVAFTGFFNCLHKYNYL